MPTEQGGIDVGEQRATDVAGLIAVEPEVALEGFEVWDLEIPGHEIADVGFVGFRGGAIFGWKCGAVGREGGGVPLCGKCLGEGSESVGELKGARLACEISQVRNADYGGLDCVLLFLAG